MCNRSKEHDLYIVNRNVKCVKCGNKGAIQFYGTWANNSKMDYAIGFGGTIPYQCTNCDNLGLIDCGRLEGYDKAFETIKS